MAEEKQSLTAEELREAFEVLKEYAPLSPEQARAVFDNLGGLKKVTVDLYEALLRKGDFDRAEQLLVSVELRSRDPRPEVARENAEILACMRHES